MDNTHDVKIGQPAPDFTLEDENGNKVKLSDLRGEPVVLIDILPVRLVGHMH